jgi:hypothetical protein
MGLSRIDSAVYIYLSRCLIATDESLIRLIATDESIIVAAATEQGELTVTVFYKDKDLRQRWQCSTMKLWRMRKAGKLNSIQLGDCGPWLTSETELQRIEAPPNTKPARSAATEQGGPVSNSSTSSIADSASALQVDLEELLA